MEVVETGKYTDAVFVQTDVCELGQGFQAFYFLDQVEGKVEPLQVDEVFQSLDAGYDVIVKA
jgi:hypothetical protein